MIMTLKNLLSEIHLVVNYPVELGNLHVRNESEYCRYALLKYFQTPKFQDDLEECLTDLLLVKDSFPVFLMLNRDKNNIFNIYLSVDADEYL